MLFPAGLQSSPRPMSKVCRRASFEKTTKPTVRVGILASVGKIDRIHFRPLDFVMQLCLRWTAIICTASLARLNYTTSSPISPALPLQSSTVRKLSSSSSSSTNKACSSLCAESTCAPKTYASICVLRSG